jgi:hypothetical protein
MTYPTVGLLLTLVLSLLVAPLAADAQPPTNVPRIALLSGRHTPTSPRQHILYSGAE